MKGIEEVIITNIKTVTKTTFYSKIIAISIDLNHVLKCENIICFRRNI